MVIIIKKKKKKKNSEISINVCRGQKKPNNEMANRYLVKKNNDQ